MATPNATGSTSHATLFLDEFWKALPNKPAINIQVIVAP